MGSAGRERRVAVARKIIQPRKRPTQKRSESSLESILKYSALILDDVGVEGFNTNEISKRSGVTIGSIYHYFPNKEAIIFELCSRWLESITDRYDEFDRLQVSTADELVFWSSLVELLYGGYKGTLGLRAINRATEIWPNIRELDVKYDEIVTTRITKYLVVLGIDVSPREQRRLSRFILNMLHFCLMLTVACNERDARGNLEDLAQNLAHLTRRHRR